MSGYDDSYGGGRRGGGGGGGRFDLGDYVDVAERLRLFREKNPEGSMQSEVFFEGPPEGPPTAVWCRAYAYRDRDDPRPGVGHSRMTIPGRTPYTKDSEVENAETSAWGRAIVAALAADTKRVASADEVLSRREPEPEPPPPPATDEAVDALIELLTAEGKQDAIEPAFDRARSANGGVLTAEYVKAQTELAEARLREKEAAK